MNRSYYYSVVTKQYSMGVMYRASTPNYATDFRVIRAIILFSLQYQFVILDFGFLMFLIHLPSSLYLILPF
mgnify:CR=1 FL=1